MTLDSRVIHDATQLREVTIMVAGFFHGDVAKVDLWFEAPNPLLGNVRPKDMVLLGRIEKLKKFVEQQLAENARPSCRHPDHMKTAQGRGRLVWYCGLCGEKLDPQPDEIVDLRRRANDAEALLREEHDTTLCLMIPIEKVGKRDGVTAPVRMCPPEHLCWWCKVDALLETLPKPEPKVMHCPMCEGQHVDRGEWATTRVHRKHLCEHCGHVWQPFVYPTVGVETL